MPLTGKRFLMFVEDMYEDLELWYPRLRLTEAGGRVTVAGPTEGHVYHGKHNYPCAAGAPINEMHSSDFDGVVIPGGFMPDKLRRDPKVLRLVREFAAAGKLVAAICHGGWIPISAGVYKGVRVTGSPGIKDDLINAGAIWEDAPVVIDRHFVSSRKPDDLPNFCRGILQVLTDK
jgi:protease I